MRQATLGVLMFATPALAEPLLEIRPPQQLADFRASLVAPAGQTVWSCEVTISKSSPELPGCPAPVDWFQGDGKYVLVGWVTSRSAYERVGLPIKIEFDASQQDEVIRVHPLKTRGSVERIRVAPTSVQLTVASEPSITATLTNGSAHGLRPYPPGGRLSMLFERKAHGRWYRFHQSWAYSFFEENVLQPNGSSSRTLSRYVTDALQPGEYRVVVLTQMLAPNGAEEKTIVHEIRSNSFVIAEAPPRRESSP